MRISLLLPLALLFQIAATGTEAVAATPGPVYRMDAAVLAGMLGTEKLVILDARGEKTYRKGHLPGALPVNWQQFAVTTGRPGSPKWGVACAPQELSRKFGELGITVDSTVVVYADPLRGWGEDGRFVWMFRTLGVENSFFLDGGYPFWEENDYPVTREGPPLPGSAEFGDVVPVDDLTVDSQWVKERLGVAQIVDSRTQKEYDGARKYKEARGGHIPGAVLIPYLTLFREDGRLKEIGDLEEMFVSAGLKKDTEIAAYCTSGIRSAFMTLVLRMAGYPKAANYDQSFYRWAADKTLPIEK